MANKSKVGVHMIYLDNNATTQMDKEVLEAMLPFFTNEYGNPSSILNMYGRHAEMAITKARRTLKRHFNANSIDDFIFTSGATESNNLILQGIANYYAKENIHIITSCIEHSSILNTCHYLQKKNIAVTQVSVNSKGIIDPYEIERAINERTVLITIMGANNEIGTIQPIDEISSIARRYRVLFHTDVTQYVGTHTIDVNGIGIDSMSFSAHKVYGPKGMGVLYANRETRRKIIPTIFGGNQQGGLRSGTLNVPSIVGLSKAIELLERDGQSDCIRMRDLQDELFMRLAKDNRVVLNGDSVKRIPNNLSLTFEDASSQFLLSNLPDLAFSTQSACSSISGNESHVLKAIGLSKRQISNTIRIGISKYTTREEVLKTAESITRVIELSWDSRTKDNYDY